MVRLRDRLDSPYIRPLRHPQRARSPPLPGDDPPTPRPPPPISHLPSLDIQLRTPRRHGQVKAVHCPEVPRGPNWSASPGYGRGENEVRLCDTRSLNDNFPFPFQRYTCTTDSLLGIPDQTLANIITDCERTPVLSYAEDTHTYISRISPTLVAKWGRNVCQAEVDMMWYIRGILGTRDHVPQLHKVLRDETTGYLILIMDYINGNNLVDIWRHISSQQRSSIAEAIARATALMRKTTARYPGPVGMSRFRVLVHKEHPMPLKVGGSEYTRYYNTLIDEINFCRLPQQRELNHVNFSKFVLANMQLDPSSFIVGKDDPTRIWIVGWGKGGFFPFECELAMAERLMPTRFSPIVASLSRGSEYNEDEKEAIEMVGQWIDDAKVGGSPIEPNH